VNRNASTRSHVARRALVVIVLLGLCVACGRKAAPLPPIIRVADPTRDLTVVQLEWLAELRWTYPQTTTAGGPLPDLEAIEVLRAEIPKAQEPTGGTDRDRQTRRTLFEARASVIATLEAEQLAAATDGAMLKFSEDVSSVVDEEAGEADTVLWYGVQSRCCRNRTSEISNIVRLQPATPPKPPEHLQVSTEKDGLHLQWQEEDIDVLVERAADGQEFERLTKSPLSESPWIDRTAEQGRTWSYRLRQVDVKADGTIIRVGTAGAPVEVEYPDEYPPEPPTELVCLPEGDQVRLRWRGSEDAAVYIVERQVGDAAFVLDDSVRSPHFLDSKAPAGGAIYLVRAVDDAGNQSGSVSCEAAPGG